MNITIQISYIIFILLLFSSIERNYKIIYLFGCFFFLIAYSFTPSIISKYFNYSELQSLVFLFAIATYSALQFILFKLIYEIFSRKSPLLGIEASLSWTLSQLLFPALVPLTTAHLFVDYNWMMKTASFGGAYFTSILILCPLELMLVIYKKRKLQRQNYITITFAILALICGQLYADRQMTTPKKSIKLALVNLDFKAQKIFLPKEQERLENHYLDIINELNQLSGIDLIIFPEQAALSKLDQNNLLNEPFIKKINSLSTHKILIGAETAIFSPQVLKFNSAILITPETNNFQIYNKRHFLPFFESWPMVSFIPWLGEQFHFPSIYNHRTQDVALNLGKGVIASIVICYEDLFSNYLRTSIKNNFSDFTISISNDTWLNNKFAKNLHSKIFQIKSIENNTPLVRVSNSGVTEAFNHLGKVILPKLSKKYFNIVEINTNSRNSIFTEYGFWILGIFTCLIWVYKLNL